MNQKNPFISVLITAYNREEFIAEAIESVINSSFQDFELIIVDDASTDRTCDIIEKYLKKDSRIRSVNNLSNLGQFPNRNKAASFAKGIYLKFLDSDDVLLPKTLEIFSDGMKKNSLASIGVEFNNCCFIKASKLFPFDLTAAKAFEWHFEKGGLLFSPPSTSIYNRKDFEKVGGFSEKTGTNADVELHLKLSAISGTVVFQAGLIFWRRHPDQSAAFQENNEFHMMLERFKIHQTILTSGNSPLTLNQTRRIMFSQKSLYMRRAILNYLIKGKLKTFYHLLHKAGLSFLDLPLVLIPLRFIR